VTFALPRTAGLRSDNLWSLDTFHTGKRHGGHTPSVAQRSGGNKPSQSGPPSARPTPPRTMGTAGQYNRM